VKNVIKTDIDVLMPVVLESVNSGNDARIKISGFSMYPLVTNWRDSVLLTKADVIKKGDVPLIKRDDGSYVLHRVVRIDGKILGLRGDYEQKIEYPIPSDNVVAVAKGFYRNEKFISCDSFGYKLYKAFWMNTVWIRPAILKVLAIRTLKKTKNPKNNVES